MTNILVPIFICVVLPVSIVLITSLCKINSDNKRSQIIMKAIEANNNIDADKLAESLKKPVKTAREILNLRLLRGCIFSFAGLGLFFASYFAYGNGASAESDPVFIPLMFGGASLAVGISYLIVYAVTRKQVNPDSEK